MEALIIGIVILIVTPLIYEGLTRNPKIKTWTDHLISLLMIYVIAGHVLPELFEVIGYHVFWLVLVGLVGMSVLESFCHGQYRGVHKGALIAVFLGFAVHIALDGVALSGDAHHHHHHHHGHGHEHEMENLSALSLAIILHRLPVAMLVWAKLYPIIGKVKAFSTLVLMAGVTVLGFVAGDHLMEHQDFHSFLSYLEAFIAGCLFHVILHQFALFRQIFHKHDDHATS